MPSRIDFRSRGRGCAVAGLGSPTGVSYIEPRVKFVKGWLTGGTDPADGSVECGDGTIYPMLVTTEQLFELMYRVRDAEWVSGSAEQTDTGAAETATVTFTATSPPTEKVEWELQAGEQDGAYTRRGYVAVTNDETPDQPLDDYDDNIFSAVQYTTVGGINGETTYPLAFREAINETAIWANASIAAPKNTYQIGHYITTTDIVDFYIPYVTFDPFKTGFSFYGASWCDSLVNLPTIYAPYSTIGSTPEYGAEVSIVFSGKVAWIDDNESGNPFDPLNSLYVGMTFAIRNSFNGRINGVGDEISHSTRLDDLYTPSSKLADLKLKLSDATYITAAIYGEDDLGGSSSTDWIFDATEWWPYKTLGGNNAWNTATGAVANGGPGA